MKTFIEHDNEIVLDEAVKYHVDNEIPLTQSVFRMYSENFFNLFKKVRELYEEGKYMPQAEEVMFLNTSEVLHPASTCGSKTSQRRTHRSCCASGVSSGYTPPTLCSHAVSSSIASGSAGRP